MKTLKIILCLASALLVYSCGGIYEDANDKATDYSKKVSQISWDSLQNMTALGTEFTLLDVRQQEDFWGGSLEGSVNIPRGFLEFKIANEDFWFAQYMYPPEKTSTLVVYSQDGTTGILACVQLMQIGYNNILNLKGGYNSARP